MKPSDIPEAPYVDNGSNRDNKEGKCINPKQNEED